MSTFNTELEKFVTWVNTEIKTLESQIELDKGIVQKGSKHVDSMHKASERVLNNSEYVNYFSQLLDYYNIAQQNNDYGYFAANMQEYLHRALQTGVFGFDRIERKFAQKISKKWIDVVASAFNQ